MLICCESAAGLLSRNLLQLDAVLPERTMRHQKQAVRLEIAVPPEVMRRLEDLAGCSSRRRLDAVASELVIQTLKLESAVGVQRNKPLCSRPAAKAMRVMADCLDCRRVAMLRSPTEGGARMDDTPPRYLPEAR